MHPTNKSRGKNIYILVQRDLYFIEFILDIQKRGCMTLRLLRFRSLEYDFIFIVKE